MRRQLIGQGVAPDRVMAFPLGSDLPRAPSKRQVERFREELGLSDAPVVLYFGAIDPKRRLDFVVRVAGRVRRLQPEARWVLMGPASDGEGDRLRGYAEELGLGQHVLVLGPVPRSEVPRYMGLASVTVSPIPTTALLFGQLAHEGRGVPGPGSARGGDAHPRPGGVDRRKRRGVHRALRGGTLRRGRGGAAGRPVGGQADGGEGPKARCGPTGRTSGWPGRWRPATWPWCPGADRESPRRGVDREGRREYPSAAGPGILRPQLTVRGFLRTLHVCRAAFRVPKSQACHST